MSSYFLIHLGIIVLPLIFSFERKITFYKKWRPISLAIIAVGIPFLVWDVIFAKKGYWGFSYEHAGTFRILDLPVEEILFFITVAYACMFVYENAALYIKELQYPTPRQLSFWMALFGLAAGLMFLHKPYTSVVFFSTSFVLLLTYFIEPYPFGSRHFLLYLAGSFAGFFIVNYLLTSPPIVWYSENAIVGARVLTIPIEDFLYCFALCSLWLITYLTVQGKMRFILPSNEKGNE